MKKPFLYAFSAALYIVSLISVIYLASRFLKDVPETIIIPMTMLSIFVLSAAVMGFLFLSEPLSLLVEGKKREAIIYFAKIVGFFACFVIIFATILITGQTFLPSF
ncbi:MAG: hypothetical protein WC724_00735 [Candidatus Paceibacterota bacterium]|jgi:hypothetical protein